MCFVRFPRRFRYDLFRFAWQSKNYIVAFLFIAFVNHINMKCYRHNQYTVAIKALKNSFQSNVYCHLQEVNASEIVSP